MARKSHYTLLIICEGRNTEPVFFDSIRDRIMEGKYVVEEMIITIRPEPSLDNDSDEKIESILKPKRKARQLLQARVKVDDEIPGVPPLKWVLAGKEELRHGTFNEVWVVFDKDNHPKTAEAFANAAEIIDGKQIQIAYSSIAFEYYLLLHFERINKAFTKSECREGKITLHCSSGLHENDCWGERCVGGYARAHTYWEKSKDKSSVFPLIEDKLQIGFWNAAWLRRESNLQFPDVIFYDRNPFVTTDSIVKRLTGYEDHKFEVLGPGEVLDIRHEFKVSFLKDLNIKIGNISDGALVLPAGCITRDLLLDNQKEKIGARKILEPGEEIVISFAPDPQDIRQSQYYFDYYTFHIMLLL